MELHNYTLKIRNMILLQDVDIMFNDNAISHVLGNNGCGKSSFGKSCVGMLKFEGMITGNEDAILIGSSSNVPGEFFLKDITRILKKIYDEEKVVELYKLLKLYEIADNLSIDKMSDGQKQKIKLYTFLSADKKLIILDEFTNALDKQSVLDIYEFINQYIKKFDCSIINITHNLSDLEYIQGDYYYFFEKKIVKISSKKEAIESYIKGEV